MVHVANLTESCFPARQAGHLQLSHCSLLGELSTFGVGAATTAMADADSPGISKRQLISILELM